MVNDLPERSIWSVGGVGDAQLMMNVNGMINGGGVRVGLEDNVWWTPRRQRLATNLDLLNRIHTIATTLEIEIASPRDVRALLELQGAGPWEGREQRDGQLTGA
jgi:3-keto-5-aminohexanoate cleavage enzyme